MNPCATTFIRACRARPSSSHSLACPQNRSDAAAAAAYSSLCRPALTPLPTRPRRRHIQRAGLSTTAPVHNAQLMHEVSSTSAQGLNATLHSQTTSSPARSTASKESADLPSSLQNTSSEKTILSTTTVHPPSRKSRHNTSYDLALLPKDLPAADLDFLTTTPTKIGTVTRVSTMSKTVRVSHNIQAYHAAYQKHYLRATHVLVHDAHDLLVEGDVIRFGEFPASLRRERDQNGKIVVKRKRPTDRNDVVKELGVRYMAREIVTPFGVELEKREPRVVGGRPGRWQGTKGEVKKVAIRQKGRRDGGRKVQTQKPAKTAEAA